MKMNDYQLQASQFALYQGHCLPETHEDSLPAIYPFLGLAEEVGEVMGKAARVFRGDTEEYDREALMLELGDVLWNLSECARQLGVSLDEVATGNLDKLISRKNRDMIRGEGDAR